MKKQLFFLLTAFLFLTTINANAQRAYKLDHKDVAKIKQGPTYFILIDENEEYNEMMKDAINKYWDFCEIKFEYQKNLKKIRKQKNITVIMFAVGEMSLRMKGKDGLGKIASSEGGIIISRRIKKDFIRRPNLWDGAFYTNFISEVDETYKFPFHIKVLNRMLHTIEENKSSRFHWKQASKVYGKKKTMLADRVLYVLDHDIPKSKKGEDFTKIETINKYYKHKVKIVSDEELKKAIEEEQDVVYLHLFSVNGFNYYSAISCETGDVFSLNTNKKKRSKKSLIWILEDMSN